MNLMCFIIACVIVAIPALLTKGSRLILLARFYFFVMAILTPWMILTEMFRKNYIVL
jgi:preprotein translocase subunit Sec63